MKKIVASILGLFFAASVASGAYTSLSGVQQYTTPTYTSFTLTLDNSPTANTATAKYWRRWDNKLCMEIYVVATGSDSVNGNYMTFNLPSGFTLKTSNWPTTTVDVATDRKAMAFGGGIWFDITSGAADRIILAYYSSSNKLKLRFHNGSAFVNSDFDTGETFYFNELCVPVNEW
jgi:hypothetical protein